MNMNAGMGMPPGPSAPGMFYGGPPGMGAPRGAPPGPPPRAMHMGMPRPLPPNPPSHMLPPDAAAAPPPAPPAVGGPQSHRPEDDEAVPSRLEATVISAGPQPAAPKQLAKADVRPAMMPAAVRIVRQQPVVKRRPAAAHMPTLQSETAPPALPAAAPAPAPATTAAASSTPVAKGDDFDDFMSSMRELGAV